MELRIEISKEKLENIFVTALEGGSNYWYYISDSEWDKVSGKYQSGSFAEKLTTFILEGGSFDVNDFENEDEVLGTISLDTMSDRLSSLAKDENYNYALFNVLRDDYDATDSDVCFQYITMGEVVFG